MTDTRIGVIGGSGLYQIDGLENAPEAFIGLLNGENFGKRVIRVGRN